MLWRPILLLGVLSPVLFGQGAYKPTEEELEHNALSQKMRNRQIDPTDFFKRLFRTKIVFYGQVVDWQGAPVEGAEVTYIPSSDFSALEGRPTKYKTTSAKDGRFTINANGMDLYVSVEKEGYRKVLSAAPHASGDAPDARLSARKFSYFNDDGRPELNHHPIEGKPVQFVIRKIGALEPLKTRDGLWRIKPDSNSRRISLNEKGSSEHCIEVVYSRESKAAKGFDSFDWSFELKVEKGGLVEQLDDGFEAPISGYKPSVMLASVSAKDPRWKDRFDDRSFYIRFDDGVCARIEINGGASYEVGENAPFVFLESHLNPNPKSRNLEAK